MENQSLEKNQNIRCLIWMIKVRNPSAKPCLKELLMNSCDGKFKNDDVVLILHFDF